MSLRQQAEADLAFILENTDDFGWDITLVSPSGVSSQLVGMSNDIGTVLDPQTGMMVSGRDVSVALRMSSLPAGLPMGVLSGKPWTVTFKDPSLNSYTFRVNRTLPDRTLGIIILKLDLYAPTAN